MQDAIRFIKAGGVCADDHCEGFAWDPATDTLIPVGTRLSLRRRLQMRRYRGRGERVGGSISGAREAVARTAREMGLM